MLLIIDIDKYKYSGYGTGFERKGNFPFPNGEFGCNVLIFGVDMSSSVHVDNKKKDILILGEGPTQVLDGVTLTAEKMYSNIFAKSKNKFCLSFFVLFIYLLMVQKLLISKQKILKM